MDYFINKQASSCKVSSCLAVAYRLFCPAGVLAELVSMRFGIAQHSE